MFSAYRHLLIKVLAVFVLLLLLGACSPMQSEPPLSTPNYPVPTINPLFNTVPSTTTTMEVGYLNSPTPSELIELLPSPSPASTSTPTPSPTPTAAPTPTPTEVYRRILIFDEAIGANWALRYSEEMVYNEKDNTVSHNGTYSISFRPQADNARLLFGPRQTADESYPRSEVVGVSFWLYSGEQELNPSDLLVSILGSNRFPFYFPDDRSVESDSEPVFPEVPLNYLDGNTPIPPQTWVEVIIRLADLPDNPDYEYVTGIQIRNAAGFRDRVYIDQVELLMAPASE